jgi:hypothetical protein
MSSSRGFWSYVHADDEAEGERISRLARDVRSQYELLTGESIELFLDKDDLSWGEDWRERIDDGLASTAFFIAVLTPRYFMSVECRRELRSFAEKAIQMGVKELVMPLLYADVPGVESGTTSDELVEANARADASGAPSERLGEGALAGTEPDDSEGLLDRLAAAEEALPEWTATIEELGNHIEFIGASMGDAQTQIEHADAQGKGFAGRLVVTRALAQRLQEPAEAVFASAARFASHLHKVDEGVRILIDSAGREQPNDPESLKAVCEYFESVRGLSEATRAGMVSTQGMLDAMGPIEAMSRDLRAPLRRVRQGLTAIMEAQVVAEEWVRLMDASGVDCSAHVS